MVGAMNTVNIVNTVNSVNIVNIANIVDWFYQRLRMRSSWVLLTMLGKIPTPNIPRFAIVIPNTPGMTQKTSFLCIKYHI